VRKGITDPPAGRGSAVAVVALGITNQPAWINWNDFNGVILHFLI